MVKIKRILFPTDLTPLAESVLEYAGWIAATFEADVQVLHVAVQHSEVDRAPEDYLPLVADEEEGGRFFLPVRGAAGPATEEMVPLHYDLTHCTSPVMGILEYSDQHDADLILMASRKRSALERLLDPSVCEEVVRRAYVPTLSVPAEVPLSWPPERLLVPIDFSEYSSGQLAYARDLARRIGAELVLLHVIEVHAPPVEYGAELGESDRYGEQVQQRAREALEALAQEAGLEADEYVAQLAHGHPVIQIPTFADEVKAGMIVIATRGRTGIEHLVIGSVTERVVRGASCPVWTLPLARAEQDEQREDHAEPP